MRSPPTSRLMSKSLSSVALIVGVGLLISAQAGASDPFDGCQQAPLQHSAIEEKIISSNTPDGRIEGTLAAPKEAQPSALTLMLHGYTGSRNEIPVARGEGMFSRTARAFAERGIATLRIDFIGSGKSDGEWSDTTFSTQARDANRAAVALKQWFDIPKVPVGVLGYSQGGLVALRAGARGAPFDRLALWNPVMDPMVTYGKIFGQDTIRNAARLFDGANTIENTDEQPLVEGTRLKPGFFAGIASADPTADAAMVTAPVLIVTGQRDPLVVDGAALAASIKESRSGDTSILDIDAGHDLGAIKEPALLDRVIACTAGFILSTGPG